MSNFIEVPPEHGGGEARFVGGCWPSEGDPVELKTVFGDVKNQVMYTRDQLVAATLENFLPPVHNQNGIGACNAFDSVTQIEIHRAQAGLPYVELSGGDLYRRICGGRDDGSLPEDGLRTLMATGVLPASVCPPLDWKRNHGTDEQRGAFRILEAYWCPTFLHLASAWMQGFSCNVNVNWWDNDPVAGDGWMQARGRGNEGGHSIPGYGLVIDPKHGLGGACQNQWGTSFGVHGRMIIPEARLTEGCKIFKCWAVREVVQESGDVPDPKFTA